MRLRVRWIGIWTQSPPFLRGVWVRHLNLQSVQGAEQYLPWKEGLPWIEEELRTKHLAQAPAQGKHHEGRASRSRAAITTQHRLGGSEWQVTLRSGNQRLAVTYQQGRVPSEGSKGRIRPCFVSFRWPRFFSIDSFVTPISAMFSRGHFLCVSHLPASLLWRHSSLGPT